VPLRARVVARAQALPGLPERGCSLGRASGRGRIVSWVVYHQAYHPAFESRLPYNVTMVQLDEGPQLLTNVTDSNEALVAEAAVELNVQWEGDVALARFRLSAA
jgi:uncharacterized OB-fold protein